MQACRLNRDFGMARLLTVAVLWVVMGVFVVLLFPVVAALQGQKLAGLVVVFGGMVILVVPMGYLWRYGYFRRAKK